MLARSPQKGVPKDAMMSLLPGQQPTAVCLDLTAWQRGGKLCLYWRPSRPSGHTAACQSLKQNMVPTCMLLSFWKDPLFAFRIQIFFKKGFKKQNFWIKPDCWRGFFSTLAHPPHHKEILAAGSVSSQLKLCLPEGGRQEAHEIQEASETYKPEEAPETYRIHKEAK